MRRFSAIYILLFAIGVNTLIAQTPAQNSSETAGIITSKEPENYLAPIKALSNIKADASDFLGLSNWRQAMMTYYSYLGDYQQTLVYSGAAFHDRGLPTGAGYDTAFIKRHKFVDAADYLTTHATLHQVVMINEAHHLPYHRAFVLLMLKKFYNAGYRYLAIETLDDTLINQKQYPDYTTGTYTSEPIFGEMIREALRLHFKLVAYESTEKCDNKSKDPNYCSRFRDSVMARNLNKIFITEPKARLLVYAGYDHIHEGSENSWKKMAQFFTELTGINPFTIETTRQVEHLDPQRNPKEFAAVNNLTHINRPVIALNDSGAWHTQFVDATVIFPQYLVKGKRPVYNSIGGMRKLYSLDSLHLKPGQFVQAFYGNEKPGKRIPADQFIVGDDEYVLYLFKGQYSLEIKDGNGVLLEKKTIEIK
ncbi:hypothetical protein [Mucilaginibacter flavidus]|uniref:hypothetical protein n=1 Tax=Mucilaginibacter flavidus TaxID=2949309 RepID=UPI002092AB4F|nr:hypothetical protein [Mucilaginibacter flavidus]MCO5947086.1 hypothetical protein [Mucilaginibacter flavidus]